MGAYEGTRLGTIALCAKCDFAIQLRRIAIPTLGECDVWEHFRVPITLHQGAPKHSVLDLPVDRATDGRY